MLEKSIIQPSIFKWAFPPVLLRKKDAKIRSGFIYRTLKKVITLDSFPIPNSRGCIDSLRRNALFN